MIEKYGHNDGLVTLRTFETWSTWQNFVLLCLVQHHSAARRQDNQRLRHSGAPSDAAGAAQAVGGPQHRAAAAAQLSFVPPAGRQLWPATGGQRRPRAVLYLSMAADTHAALLMTIGQSQEPQR